MWLWARWRYYDNQKISRYLAALSCPRMRFDSEWVSVMCPDGTGSKIWFQSTGGKVKSDLQNRFKQEIAFFLGHPVVDDWYFTYLVFCFWYLLNAISKVKFMFEQIWILCFQQKSFEDNRRICWKEFSSTGLNKFKWWYQKLLRSTNH